MTGKLIVNPFLHIETHHSKNYFLVAPKPGDSLRALKLDESERPALHELFLDLAETKFDFLDIEKDISRDERDLLVEHGVLVDEENAPQLPLFACMLDWVDAEPYAGDPADLIVNPTFRFEPFNFANVATWIHEKHMSPHLPSVWIRSPLTGIEIGYWLDQEHAKIAADFIPGDKPAPGIDEELLAKLAASGILTTAGRLRRSELELHEALEAAKQKFEREKYAVLENILPPLQMKAMRSYYRQYVSNGFMPFGDQQVNLRFREHNEPLARFYHSNLTRLMCLVTGEDVIPSYVYAASYKEGAALDPHTDRAQCEFSISFQVDYLPEPENQVSPWAIHLQKLDRPLDKESVNGLMLGWEDFPEILPDGEKRAGLHLASGDGLLYRGRELIHYRYALPAGHHSTSLFFHYVAKDFEGELN